MKKHSRKLTLDRSTIRVLTDAALTAATGGGSIVYTGNYQTLSCVGMTGSIVMPPISY